MALQDPAASSDVAYRTVAIDGINIFYREAGRDESPVILLLHGWPSSSHMFRDLIPQLADRFHVIAPDYPGFGYSDAPLPAEFEYTFDNLANIVEKLVDTLGIRNASIYMQDYGGPIGFRLATKRPELVRGLIIQNSNAYIEGISENLAPLTRYWEDQSPETVAAVRAFLTLDTTKFQYVHGASNPELVSPDAWLHDQMLLDRPGNDAVQLALFYDYRTNPPLYPAWQNYLRASKPPTLVVSGKNDPFFLPAGAEAIGRDNTNARVILLDGGHFALEEHNNRIAAEIRAFEDDVAKGSYSS